MWFDNDLEDFASCGKHDKDNIQFDENDQWLIYWEYFLNFIQVYTAYL